MARHVIRSRLVVNGVSVVKWVYVGDKLNATMAENCSPYISYIAIGEYEKLF